MQLPPTIQSLLDAPLIHVEPPMYPCSDGKPMADNSRQLYWIVLLYANLCWLFRGRQDVAVHGNMIWYPEQGNPKQQQAPDVFVVFGRPPGERESYLQWQEDHVPPTVVFEILSPSNSVAEMARKQEFYEYHGVEEYYEYDPQSNWLSGFRRQGSVWIRIRPINGWVSPRLNIRFRLEESGLIVETADGQPFLPFEEVAQRWHDTEKQLALEKQRAELAEKQLALEKQRGDQAEERANSIQEKFRRLVELSRKVRLGQASAEEREELTRLEQESESL